jgi:hypothetical protein
MSPKYFSNQKNAGSMDLASMTLQICTHAGFNGSPASGTVRRRWQQKTIAIGLCVLAFFRTCQTLWNIRDHYTDWDFSHYYTPALAARLHLNPYTTDLTDLANTLHLHIGTINHGDYPPTFIVCFEPLTLLTPAVAFWIWMLLNLALLAILLQQLSRRIAATDRWAAYSFAALAILYPPLHQHLHYAQSQILVSVLLLAMYSAGDEVAGMSLALATLLSLFPAIMSGYFVARRRWRAVLYFIVGLAAGGLATFVTFGFIRSISFIRAIPFLMSTQWLAYNISIGPLVSSLYLLLYSGRSFRLRSFGLQAIIFLLRLLVVSLAWLLTSKYSTDKKWDSRAFPVWVVTMILIAPTAWPHYMVMLYIPFAMIVWNFLEGGRAQPMRLAELAYGVMLAARWPAGRLSYTLDYNCFLALSRLT